MDLNSRIAKMMVEAATPALALVFAIWIVLNLIGMLFGFRAMAVIAIVAGSLLLTIPLALPVFSDGLLANACTTILGGTAGASAAMLGRVSMRCRDTSSPVSWVLVVLGSGEFAVELMSLVEAFNRE